MKLTSVGVVIARRELTLDGDKTVTVEIGKPGEFPGGGGYYCPFKISGMLGDKVRHAGGVDEVQALHLGLQMIGTVLSTSDEAKNGLLRWVANPEDPACGFPLSDKARRFMEGTTKDMADLSDDELDALLLAQAKTTWRKVAMVVGKAMLLYDIWDEDRLGKRIAALVEAGKLESQGNIRKWRYSEVRLPEGK